MFPNPFVGGFDCDLAESQQAVLRWCDDRLAREGWTFEGVARPIVVEGMWTRGDFIVRLGVVRFSGSTNLNLSVLRRQRQPETPVAHEGLMVMSAGLLLPTVMDVPYH